MTRVNPTVPPWHVKSWVQVAAHTAAQAPRVWKRRVITAAKTRGKSARSPGRARGVVAEAAGGRRRPTPATTDHRTKPEPAGSERDSCDIQVQPSRLMPQRATGSGGGRHTGGAAPPRAHLAWPRGRAPRSCTVHADPTHTLDSCGAAGYTRETHAHRDTQRRVTQPDHSADMPQPRVGHEVTF